MRACCRPLPKRLDRARQVGIGDRRRVDHVEGEGQHPVAAEVDRGGVLHVADQLLKVDLLDTRDVGPDPLVQHQRAEHRRVADVVVGRLPVVPAGQERLVDHVRVGVQRLDALGRGLGVVVAPQEAPLAQGREVWVDAGWAHRVRPRVEVGDVVAVDVEPVERVGDLVRGPEEVLRGLHPLRVVELREAERGGVDLVEVGVAELGVGDRLAVHRRPRDDDAQLGAERGQCLRAGGGLVGRGRDP